MKKTLLLFFASAMVPAARGVVFNSAGSGTWDTPANWAPAGVPNPYLFDSAVIGAGDVISYNGVGTAPFPGGNLAVANGNSITINGGTLNQTWVPGAAPPFGTAIAIGITGPANGTGTLNINAGGLVDTGTANALAVGVTVAALGASTGNGTVNINDGTLRLGAGAGVGAPGAQGLGVGIDPGAVGLVNVGDGAGAAGSSILDLATNNAVGYIGATLSGPTGGTGTMVISSDGVVNQGTSTVFVGDDGGTGTLTISGGAYNSTTGILSVADGGTGTLNLSSGSLTTGGEVRVGIAAGGAGNFNVSGGTGTISGETNIGRNAGGNGTLTQTGGALNTAALFVGRDAGTGNLAASAGTLASTGDIRIGQDNGTGIATINGGAVSTTQHIDLGFGGTSTGTLNISSGSFGSALYFNVGRDGGIGVINQTGGTVSFGEWMAIGLGAGPNGSKYDISAGAVSSAAGIEVAADRDGSMSISGTANVAVGGISVGVRNASSGTLNISGGTTTVTGDFATGGTQGAGTGVSNVTGGTVTAGRIRVGAKGGNGTLNYSGGSLSSGELVIASNRGIGDDDLGGHTGVVNVSGGAILGTSGWTEIGRGPGSTGTLNVTGAGSVWNNTSGQDAQVGYNGGTGNLNITGGGKVNHNWWINVARGAGSTGNVKVSGAGSELTTTGGRIVVGEDGTGTMIIENGAVVNHNSGERFTVAQNVGSTGVLTVDNATLNKNTGEFRVGGEDPVGARSGTLNIVNGGVVNHLSASAFIIGQNGATGVVNVSGAGSVLKRDMIGANTGDLILGIGGGGSQGTLNVLNGGKVNNNWWTVIADEPTATASMLIDGAGSQLNVASPDHRIAVGRQGTGSLTLSNGGEVNANTHEMHVGMWTGGVGTLNVNSGGKINGQLDNTNGDPGARTGMRLFLGTDAPASGTMNMVDGTVSVESLTVGNNGMATVNQSGGTINSNQWTEIGRDRDAGAHTPVYNMNGGVLNTQSLSVGQRRNGAMVLNAGTVNVGTNGTVSVNYWGGFHVGNAGPTEDGGSHANGQFTQNGGTLNLTEEANVGNQGGTVGVWNMNGGTVHFGVADRRIHVGRRGNGTMNINGGTIDPFQGFNVGAEAAPAGDPATVGLLNINLANASDTIRTTDLHIGFGNRPTSGQTTGTVNLVKGTLRVDGWTEIGRGGAVDGATVGGKGTLNIAGPDAFFEHGAAGTADVVVGYQLGVGELKISGGGKMNHNWWVKAGSEGGTGTVTVTDPGSVMNLTDGNLVVGENNGGVGFLNVLNGGVINHANMGAPAGDVNQYRLMIAEGAGTKGTMVVDGVGSKVNLAPKAGASNWNRIAANGEGSLTVSNSGEVNIMAEVNGSNGFLNGDQNVLIAEGNAAKGILNIASGAKVNIGAWMLGTSWTDNAVAGSGIAPTSAAQATINISGGELNLISDNLGDEPDLILARRGTTAYNQSGGTATVNGQVAVGYEPGGSATMNISGGVFNNNNGDSSMLVGRQSVNSTEHFGTAASNLNISGTGILNRNPGNGDPQANALIVGHETGGRGNMAVSGGGTVNTTQEIRFGNGANSIGTLMVDAGTINSSAVISVGRNDGQGTMNMLSGTVGYNQWMTVGHEGGTGTLNMGGGTLVSGGGGLAGEFLVGVDDNGHVTPTQGTLNHSGGSIASDNVVFGRNTNGGSLANLSGTGILSFGQLRFGQGGAANSTANITGNYLLSGRNAADKGYINIGDSNTGTVNVTMDGGTMNFNAWMDIGIGSGLVDPTKTKFTVVGGVVNGFGTGQVQPAGIAVGSDHGGTLEIGGTATLNVTGMSLGTFGDRGGGAAGNGVVNMNAGTVNNTGDLTVGANFNGGPLTSNGAYTQSGGSYSVGGNVNIATNARTTGSLAHLGGTLAATNNLTMGNGINTPTFSTTGNFNVAGAVVPNQVTIGNTASVNGGTADVAGNLLVNALGTVSVTGNLNVNNGNPLGTATAGNLNVTGGLARVNGTANVTGLVNVGATGTLGGIGTVNSAGVFVADGGTLAPGNSPGTLTINGPMTLNANSIMNYELGPVAGPNDLTIVNGLATLTAPNTLNISAQPGFDSATADGGIYTLIDGLTLTANPAGVTVGSGAPVNNAYTVTTHAPTATLNLAVIAHNEASFDAALDQDNGTLPMGSVPENTPIGTQNFSVFNLNGAFRFTLDGSTAPTITGDTGLFTYDSSAPGALAPGAGKNYNVSFNGSPTPGTYTLTFTFPATGFKDTDTSAALLAGHTLGGLSGVDSTGASQSGNLVYNVTAVVIPEPAVSGLLAVLLGFGFLRRRR